VSTVVDATRGLMHPVVGDRALAVDRPAVVLRVGDGGRDVVPGGGRDGVQGGPGAQRDDLGAVVVEVPGEQVGLEGAGVARYCAMPDPRTWATWASRSSVRLSRARCGRSSSTPSRV
jgi:hypothetical protein